MTSRVKRMAKKGALSPPKWLPDNTHYEVLTGSVAYGISNDTSDMDIYGFCIPPKDDVFPHLRGEILGFGRQKKRFEQYQQHHIKDPDAGKEYDFTVYSIVKYFHLCMENNPNMVDTLFVPQRCVLHCSRIGQLVRDNRKNFLHKGSYHKFRGYLFAQLNKIETKSNSSNPKRKETIEKFGFDTKFATHAVRLGLECEQILLEGTLDLEKNREVLKAIRRGEWSLEDVKNFAQQKERHLDDLYQKSNLPYSPNEAAIKKLLLECMEEHYGSLSEVVHKETNADIVLDEMQRVIDKWK